MKPLKSTASKGGSASGAPSGGQAVVPGPAPPPGGPAPPPQQPPAVPPVGHTQDPTANNETARWIQSQLGDGVVLGLARNMQAWAQSTIPQAQAPAVYHHGMIPPAHGMVMPGLGVPSWPPQQAVLYPPPAVALPAPPPGGPPIAAAALPGPPPAPAPSAAGALAPPHSTFVADLTRVIQANGGSVHKDLVALAWQYFFQAPLNPNVYGHADVHSLLVAVRAAHCPPPTRPPSALLISSSSSPPPPLHASMQYSLVYVMR